METETKHQNFSIEGRPVQNKYYQQKKSRKVGLWELQSKISVGNFNKVIKYQYISFVFNFLKIKTVHK